MDVIFYIKIRIMARVVLQFYIYELKIIKFPVKIYRDCKVNIIV